jgi:predicted nuclease of predicted toxin-antitoxin system
VKLLFDQNLSRKLKARLSDCFPESAHVREFELEPADDRKSGGLRSSTVS